MRAASLNPSRPVLMEYDHLLVWITLALLAIGLVMVYSASIATSEASKFTGFRPEYYLQRHGLYILLGSMREWRYFKYRCRIGRSSHLICSCWEPCCCCWC